MGATARTLACRFSIAVAIIASAAFAADARAGTYEVVTCDVAPGGVNHSWSASTTTSQMWAGENCPTAGRDSGGLFAGSGVNVGTIPAFATSSYSFDAPAGTSIAYLAARYTFHRAEPYWRLGLFADGAMLHGCEPAAHETGCYFNSSSTGTTSDWGFSPGVHRVAVQATCGSAGGCRSDTAAPSGDRAGVRLYSATVRVSDSSAPTTWDVGDGGLTNGAWQRGSQYVGYASSDNVGIRRTRLYVDGRQLHDDGRECDFTLRVPCSDVTYARYTVDTAALADGEHQVRVESVDTAANAASLTTTFHSDNTAPDAPTDVAVEGGEGWRRTNQFKLTWKNSASASQIAIAHYELCNTATGVCTWGGRSGGGINSISDLSVPEPGDYTLRLTLQDYAGNMNPANRSVPVHLRFDDVPPGRAEPVQRNGWLDAVEAKSYDQRIRLGVGEVQPVSGIAGYSVTTDGSSPDETLDVQGGTFAITHLPEGLTTVTARAVSNAGVASRVVGRTTVAVDKSPPVASADGAPDFADWARGPVALQVNGIDQPALSGMSGASAGNPIEEGAYIAFRLDGAPVTLVAGGVAAVTAGSDGEHVVTFKAVDLAGNESVERSVRFRIDSTGPELVVFEDQATDDPRRIAVAASDRTSGIADGVIEIRRLGDTGQQGWHSLSTARVDDRFVATIDDDSLERSVYELRARVKDAAGNESTGDRRRDGSAARIDVNALRLDTTIAVAWDDVKKGKPRCMKKKKKGKRSCRPGKSVPQISRTTVRPVGQSVVARGSMTSGSGGTVPDAVVDVYFRPKRTGAEFTPIATTHADAAGGFAFKAAAMQSGTYSFRYAGSARHRPSADDVTLGVPADSTIAAKPRAVRNRQAVTFKGRLRTRPAAGTQKALHLQAFYRGRWRTFATPRANSKGAWRYRYRFGATRGRVTYRFRLAIPPEDGFPYELGYSKVVQVRVTG